MSNISDIIEQFILKTLGEDESLDISRNELANYFSVAPSQINYVLETRFTTDRGYIKESKRGGGGFIKIIKIEEDNDDLINRLILESVGDELSFKRAQHILDKLKNDKIVNDRECGLILSAISENSLSIPFVMKDKIRAIMFKNVLLYLLKEKKNV